MYHTYCDVRGGRGLQSVLRIASLTLHHTGSLLTDCTYITYPYFAVEWLMDELYHVSHG